MKKSILRNRCALGALSLALGLTPGIANAQNTGDAADNEDIIVVTGSFIRGTPEDAAQPVDTFRSEELDASGVSSPLEFIKDLPQVGSVLGDTNQFSTAAQGNQGLGSINLRGLGPQRTLVLFNGRRTFTAPGAVGGGFGDTNAVPLFALDRIEILKDGAAATYGSDAIAGVANFVTKSDFEGIEIKSDYEFINGSDDNYTASILVGKTFGDVNIMAGFGWQHRSELPTTERSYSRQPYAVNPAAWSSLGTPGHFFVPGNPGFGGSTRDVGCSNLGGVEDVISGLFPVCRFSFVPFDNLVEETDRYQGYIQASVDLSDTTRFRGEFTYAQTDLDSIGTSPGYPPLQGPGGAGLGGGPAFQGFSVPVANPGVAPFLAQTGAASPLGGRLFPFFWRPYGWLGNPTDARGSGRQFVNSKAYRFSGTLEKDFSDSLRGQFSLTLMDYSRRGGSPGIIGSRLQAALNGLGGPNCTGNTPGANGCLWFNPFTNAGPGNPTLGLDNPFYVPGAENTVELANWISVPNGNSQNEQTIVADLIFSGEFGMDLGGGPVGWAAGAQYRKNRFRNQPLNQFGNLDINPCPVLGDTTCSPALQGAGSFIFLGGQRNVSLTQDVVAAFAEVKVPIGDRFEVTAAARFESYGGSIGSTFNPKGSARWEPTDWLVLRGSVGTTFRAPLASQVSTNAVTSLAGLAAAGGDFKAVDIAGNPTTLGPETAFTYNVGAIVDFGGFNFSVDYWSFDFEDEITTTDGQAIASNVVPIPDGLANCSSPFAGLITFAGGACVQGTTVGDDISRVFTQWVNGPKTKTTGLDFEASYTTDIAGGVYTIGVNASHVLTYKVGDFNLNGTLLRPGFSAVGLANLDRAPGSISPWRGNAFINYNIAGLNLRYGFKYIDGVRDERCPALPAPCATTSFGPTNFGRNISSYSQHDFHLAYDLPIDRFDAQLQFSVENFTNEDASSARTQLGYNPFTGNPLGRFIRIGMKLGI